jgi:hypothetical protein
MVLASVLGIWFGPAAPYSQHFSAPHPLRRVCGFFFFFFLIHVYVYIYMVEVRSAWECETLFSTNRLIGISFVDIKTR